VNETYPDTNGNGIPDAFENRLSITDILNPERQALDAAIIGEKGLSSPGDDKETVKWHIYSVADRRAVLLEVDRPSYSRRGVSVFYSRAELGEFIERLQNAGWEAFGDQP
jgi:hypothetical protein